MRTLRSSLLAFVLGTLAAGAQTTGVQPPPAADPGAPGALHPMPIPRQTPPPTPPGVKTPEVRHPATSNKKSGRKTTTTKAKTETEQTAPAGGSPKAKTEARPQP